MKTLIVTGGHHSSSLLVAQALKRDGWNIIWLGHKYSMWGDTHVSGEYQDVLAAGIRFIDLKAGKFYRTYNPLKLVRIPYGFIKAFLLLLDLKLSLKSDLKGVFSSGGYLAVPTVISAWLLGLPSLTHEQTAVGGWANKLLKYFVNKVCVSWPVIHPTSKTIFTGLPLRPELSQASRSRRRSKLIYITGGKQGSHQLNKVVFSCLSELLKDYTVIHQTGSSSLYNDSEQAAKISHPGYSYFTYDFQKATQALISSELVIGRSGAHTVYELAALKKNCVLIPIPWVSHNEQYINAKILVDNQQAILLPEASLSTETLLQSIKQALKLKPRQLTVPLNATESIVNLINQTFI